MLIKKCLKCGATVEVYNDCNCEDCGMVCCGEKMTALVPNLSDGAIEKHLPLVERDGDIVKVTVAHPMDQDHYIDAIILDAGIHQIKRVLKPGEQAKATFPYVKGSTIYSLCNKHGLWSIDVL